PRSPRAGRAGQRRRLGRAARDAAGDGRWRRSGVPAGQARARGHRRQGRTHGPDRRRHDRQARPQHDQSLHAGDRRGRLHARGQGRGPSRGAPGSRARRLVRPGADPVPRAARRRVQGRLRHAALRASSRSQGPGARHRARARVRRADGDGGAGGAAHGRGAGARLGREGLECSVAPAGRARPGPGAELAMSLPLDGVRVLELARFQAGPRGGMLLSDLGAGVIKIGRPGGGETRQHPPMVRGQSVYFTVYNRGKKSVCVDLRHPRGKELFAALVKKSDMVLENFRPGVMKAMGFDYERLRELNPGIILISVSGFGQYGPYVDRPAFDPLGQAMSGLMTLTGQPVGRPIGTASSVVDRYTALHATIGALAALRHRERTGEGQVVDVCLLDSALTMVEIPTSYYLATGAEGGEAGRPPYRTKDGWVVISAAGRD